MNINPTNSKTSYKTCSNSTENYQHQESTGIKSRIHPQHYTEWLNSCVDPEIINLNVQPLSGTTPYEYLLYGLPESERRNDGRLRDYWLEKYRHVEHGGWWCSGIDLLTEEDSLWGGFKPYSPRSEKKTSGFGQPPKTKVIKYEHPPKVPTEIFALKVPQHIWDLIASRVGLKRYHSPLALRLTARRKPITFWEWILKNPQIPIVITEGAKKAGALLTAGYVAIALPGIFNGYRQPKDEFGKPIGKAKLIPQLEILAKAGREFIFAFDCDSQPKTVAAVRKAILKTGKLLQQKGSSVSVITWHYPYKGVDDLIAAYGVECFHALYTSRINLSQFQLLELLDLSPYVCCRVNQRYLGLSGQEEEGENGRAGDKETGRQGDIEDSLDEFDSFSEFYHPELQDFPNPEEICPLSPHPPIPPPDAQIIAIKSAKGTGKTEWLTTVVAQANAAGKRALVITHRIQLARALCNRFGIDHIEEIRSSEFGGILGYGLCIDSLHSKSKARFNPHDWSEAIIILDEAEQIIWHLLNSKTCRANRVAILETFQQLLQTVVSTGGKIYLSDADLSPISIQYIQSLIGYRVKTWVVENTYNPNTGKRKLYRYDRPEALLSSLVKAIAAGERVIVHTGAQKVQSPWGTINLELMLASLYPKLKILRIDGESVADPEHPAYGCTGNLNEILSHYDLVIASPTIETGVSIDIKHFHSVWCLASGVQTVDAVAQTLERVRDNVPRHLWVKKSSSTRIGRGETDIKALLRSTHSLTKHNIGLLSYASAVALDETEPSHTRTWAKRGCIINMGFWRYRESLLAKLAQEGYEILDPIVESMEDSLSAKELIKTTANVNYDAHCVEVSTESSCSDSEYEELKNKPSKTKTERLKVRKGELERKYATDEVSPSMVKLDDDGWYARLRFHYFLTRGRAFLEKRDRAILTKMEELGNGKFFKPDVNERLLSSPIAALERLEISQFLDPNRQFTSDSLREWFEKISQPRPRAQIRTILGINIAPERDTPIAVAQRLLKLLGLKMSCLGRLGSRGARARVYRGCNLDPDGRQDIFERWFFRDSEKYRNDSCPPFL